MRVCEINLLLLVKTVNMWSITSKRRNKHFK